MAYATQLAAKERAVKRALCSHGLGAVPLRPILPSPSLYHCARAPAPSPTPTCWLRCNAARAGADRNKVQWTVSPLAAGGDDGGGLAVGFFPARPPGAAWSPHVVDLATCELAPRSAPAVLSALRAALRRHAVAPFHPLTGKGLLSMVTARWGRGPAPPGPASPAAWHEEAEAGTGQLMLTLHHSAPAEDQEAEASALASLQRVADSVREALAASVAARLVAVVAATDERAARAASGRKAVHGREVVLAGDQRGADPASPATVEEHLCGLTFRASTHAFLQPNTAQAEALYALVGAAVEEVRPACVWDLFCGTGTMAAVLARHAPAVVGVELVADAVLDARASAGRNGLDNVHFLQANLARPVPSAALASLPEPCHRPDVVVVDPPRAGLSSRLVRSLAQLRPTRIVYVSCNPATQARDLALLRREDPHLAARWAQPLDMTPHTAHVENVVVLDRE